MIFEISATAADLEAANRQQLHDVVSDLLQSHRQAHHLVIVARNCADWLIANGDFNARDRAMLLRLRSEYTQTAGLLISAAMRITVAPAHSLGPVVDTNRIVIGLNDVNWTYLLQRVNLIVEDAEYDGRLYDAIFKATKGKIGAPNISFDKRNGGGTGIFHVWRHQIAEGHIVCLVADSDRRHPDSAIPAKFGEALSFAGEAGSPFAWCMPLPCLEIENLIPVKILRELPCVFEKPHEIDALEKIETSERSAGIDPLKRFWLYFDLKQGIKNSDLLSSTPAGMGEWYVSRKAVGGSMATYRGFGENVLHQVVNNGEALGKFVREILTRGWWDTFGGFFSFVLWLGFAPIRNAL